LEEELDDRLTLQEACKRLEMSRDQVILRIQKKDLDGGQYFGRWWYVKADSVERYIKRERRRGTLI